MRILKYHNRKKWLQCQVKNKSLNSLEVVFDLCEKRVNNKKSEWREMEMHFANKFPRVHQKSNVTALWDSITWLTSKLIWNNVIVILKCQSQGCTVLHDCIPKSRHPPLKAMTAYMTLDHKTSHKGQFSEVEIYTSSESWINKLSIDVRTNKKLSFNIFTVGNSLNIFMEHNLCLIS